MPSNKNPSTPPSSPASKKKKPPKKQNNKTHPKNSNSKSNKKKSHSGSNTPTSSPTREYFLYHSIQKQAPSQINLNPHPNQFPPETDTYPPTPDVYKGLPEWQNEPVDLDTPSPVAIHGKSHPLKPIHQNRQQSIPGCDDDRQSVYHVDPSLKNVGAEHKAIDDQNPGCDN